MPADNQLAVHSDVYRKTAMELTDLIRDLESFAEKFKHLAQSSGVENADSSQIQTDAQKAYRDLGTLIELAARLARPQ